MDSGYYAACAGLRAQTQALELIASNVANISTTGFRGQQPMFRSLLASTGYQMADPLNQAINDFGVLEGSRADLSAGNLERTGNSLDLAIEGNGFFAIQTHGQTLYTRNGNFQVSVEGTADYRGGRPGTRRRQETDQPAERRDFDQPRWHDIGQRCGCRKITDRRIRTRHRSDSRQGTHTIPFPQPRCRPAPDSNVRQGMLESSNINSVKAVST